MGQEPASLCWVHQKTQMIEDVNIPGFCGMTLLAINWMRRYYFLDSNNIFRLQASVIIICKTLCTLTCTADLWMCVSLCVCVCVVAQVWVYVDTCVYLCGFVCVLAFMRVWLFVCVCVCMCKHTHTHTQCVERMRARGKLNYITNADVKLNRLLNHLSERSLLVICLSY